MKKTVQSTPREATRVAAFFDLDKTVIATSSAYAYGREFMNNGLITPATALQLSIAKAMYMFSGHTSEQMDSTKDQLAAMVAGWDVDQVRKIGEETLHNVVTPTIYAEARDLIDAHLDQGHEVIIISASATDLIEPIARELGVTRTVGSVLGVEDGKYTGELLFYCKGPAKAEAIASLARERNYDLSKSFAYSDSATDIPMLEAVGHAVAVNPDRTLRKAALARGWDIRTFKNPEPLFQTRDVSIGAGVVAGIAAVTVGGWWLARRGKPGTA